MSLEEKLVAELGLKLGFIQSIHSESDWGFTIKVNALVESALMHLLNSRFKEPLLSGILSNLATGSDGPSKVEILRKLNLLSKEKRSFVRNLGRVRNYFAHEIKSIDSTLVEYCEMDSERKSALLDSMKPFFADPITIKGTSIPRNSFLSTDIRGAIFLCTLLTVIEVVNSAAKLNGQETIVPDGTVQIPKAL